MVSHYTCTNRPSMGEQEPGGPTAGRASPVESNDKAWRPKIECRAGPRSCRRAPAAGHPPPCDQRTARCARSAASRRRGGCTAASTRRRRSWSSTRTATRISSSATTGCARTTSNSFSTRMRSASAPSAPCKSGRRVRLDLTLDAPASPATRISPAEARALRATVDLGVVPTLDRPSLWPPPWRDPARPLPRSPRLPVSTWAEDTYDCPPPPPNSSALLSISVQIAQMGLIMLGRGHAGRPGRLGHDARRRHGAARRPQHVRRRRAGVYGPTEQLITALFRHLWKFLSDFAPLESATMVRRYFKVPSPA